MENKGHKAPLPPQMFHIMLRLILSLSLLCTNGISKKKKLKTIYKLLKLLVHRGRKQTKAHHRAWSNANWWEKVLLNGQIKILCLKRHSALSLCFIVSKDQVHKRCLNTDFILHPVLCLQNCLPSTVAEKPNVAPKSNTWIHVRDNLIPVYVSKSVFSGFLLNGDVSDLIMFEKM